MIQRDSDYGLAHFSSAFRYPFTLEKRAVKHVIVSGFVEANSHRLSTELTKKIESERQALQGIQFPSSVTRENPEEQLDALFLTRTGSSFSSLTPIRPFSCTQGKIVVDSPLLSHIPPQI